MPNEGATFDRLARGGVGLIFPSDAGALVRVREAVDAWGMYYGGRAADGQSEARAGSRLHGSAAVGPASSDWQV